MNATTKVPAPRSSAGRPLSLLRAVGLAYSAPEPVIGPKVMLRMPDMADYGAWMRLREASRRFLVPWEPAWPPDDLSRTAFRRRIARYRQDWRDDQGYAFFLYRKEDGALVGGLTLTNVRRGVAQTISLGYWMGEAFAGRGYMSAGVRTAIPYAFGVLGFRRVEAACVPQNAASVGLLERVGFTREGLARQYLCINGTWTDHALYAFVQGDRLG
ncbi:MAG: GNAT family N-acetyltransferase [Phreatobacter sp.]|nr:GNAT family N-acetyltransferase [Phreatobacter sp.]